MKIKNILFNIFIINLLIIPFSTKAQVGSTLQFHQVLFLTATVNNTGAQWTVPAGKVWKIEDWGTRDNADGGLTVFLNSQRAFYYSGEYYSSSYSMPNYRYSFSPGVLWLPENTTLGTQCTTGTSFRWFSVIEYSVLP